MSASPSEHDVWADAVGAYLLEALPYDERAAFEAHLRDCVACRRDVEALRVAADALPVAVPQMEAPPQLKDRIMGAVRAEARLLEAAGERADAPDGRPSTSGRAPWWRRPVTLRPALALVAASALLLVGGLVGFYLFPPPGDTVLGQVDERVAPGAKVSLAIEGDAGYLVASRLPAPPPGRVYQVWVQRGDEPPRPTETLFVPRRDGSARAAVPPGATDADAILVTDEPRGGSDAPTRMPFITIQPA